VSGSKRKHGRGHPTRKIQLKKAEAALNTEGTGNKVEAEVCDES